jgi:hypothetical protein
MYSKPTNSEMDAVDDAKVSCPTADILNELRELAERSVDARARLREFLNSKPVIAALKVDWSATARAGHTVMYDEPTQRLLDSLTAIRAVAKDEQRCAFAG